METQVPDWLSTIHGRIDKGDLQVRQTYLQLTWPCHLQQFLLPRTLQQNQLHTLHGESSIHSLIFLIGPNCEVCRRPKVTRAPCKRNPDDRADRIKIAERFGDMIAADHKVLDEEQESRLHHKCGVVAQDLATQWIQSNPWKTKSAEEIERSQRTFSNSEEKPQMCSGCARLGNSMDSKLSMQNQISSGDDEKSSKLPAPRRKSEIHLYRHSVEFINACVELNWNHERSTPLRSETHGIA